MACLVEPSQWLTRTVIMNLALACTDKRAFTLATGRAKSYARNVTALNLESDEHPTASSKPFASTKNGESQECLTPTTLYHCIEKREDARSQEAKFFSHSVPSQHKKERSGARGCIYYRKGETCPPTPRLERPLPAPFARTIASRARSTLPWLALVVCLLDVRPARPPQPLPRRPANSLSTRPANAARRISAGMTSSECSRRSGQVSS